MVIQNIIIIGTGWYGLHTALLLQNKYNVIILEKNTEIFNNSSNYNQNRLHLGYHYPRCAKTREICYKGYHKFIDNYRNVVDFIDNNYYCISKDSIIDYTTYLQIYNINKYNHTIIKNNIFNNIDGDIINTQEKIINSIKSKNYFKKNIKCEIKFNYTVTDIKQINNKVIINNELECDLLFDCTYNQLNLSKNNYIYENTISLLYKRINFNDNYESLTVMDGDFFSLFPRDVHKKLYTLTHVKYTPFIKSNNIEDLNLNSKSVITTKELNLIKNNMIKEVKEYIPNFLKNYTYVSYFTSYKCKLLSNNDNRSCIIEKHNNIISVNCGKIIGIFELEEYIKSNLELL
jgi:hypothetical protein